MLFLSACHPFFMLIRKLTLHVVLVALVITVPHLPIGYMIHTQPTMVPYLPVPRHWSKGIAQVGPIRDLPGDLIWGCWEQRVSLGFRL